MNKLQIVKDVSGKKMHLSRSFDSTLNKVWNAWTKSEFLDLWWAPKPWKTETKTINFTEGGTGYMPWLDRTIPVIGRWLNLRK